MKRHIAISLIMIMVIIAFTSLIAIMFYSGLIRFNYPSLKEYPIQGIDVSNHQKQINWSRVDKRRVHFALIKATEGGDFKDKSFERNWRQAKQQGIVVGAYHFFTFCKSGEEQALNFIESVPVDSLSLPPAIDLEYSGNCKLTKSKEELLSDIQTFIRIVESHYKKRMIIYVPVDFYNNILAGQFLNNYYWIRGIYGKPQIKNGPEWTFWQYSNKGRMRGIESFVDLNVFRGTIDDFNKIIQTKNKIEQ